MCEKGNQIKTQSEIPGGKDKQFQNQLKGIYLLSMTWLYLSHFFLVITGCIIFIFNSVEK